MRTTKVKEGNGHNKGSDAAIMEVPGKTARKARNVGGGNHKGKKAASFDFYQMLDSLSTNVFFADTDLILRYVNKRGLDVLRSKASELRQAFNVDVEDLIGVCIDIFHGARVSEIRSILGNRANFPIKKEIGFAGLILDLNVNVVLSKEGEVHGYVVNWEEISEKKKLESEMTRTKNMVENAPINIMMADLDCTIVYMNPKSLATLKTLEQYLPCKADEVVGGSVDRFHKNPAHQRKILGNPDNLPYQANITVGPETLDLLVTALYDAKGQYSGAMVTWEVITEKLQNEMEMARFRNMIENAPINVLLADTDLNLVYINPKSKETLKRLEKYLPVTVDELQGLNLDRLHKNPAHQRRILADPANLPHRAKIKVGEETLDLVVSAILDHEGKYLGPMATWDIITEKIDLVDTLTTTSDDLSSSAEELLAVAKNMIKNSEETTEQSTTAAASSEEISTGVQTMATSMEEMTASIKEITVSTNESSKMSNEATTKAKAANDIITKLGDSSQDIGAVIKVISSIAQQTNLLALNATIEAARAGDAGKGFAVVANEVKELAKETGKATADITKKIEAIQGDSGGAVTSIEEISQSIDKLNTIAGTIATAIEEQSATTNNVSRVVQESASSIKGISTNVSEVSKAAQLTGEGCKQTEEAASNLSKLAVTLKELVKKIEV